MLASAALLLGQALDVLRNLELLAAIPTASVDCDEAVFVHDTHLVETGKHDGGAAGPIMGNGVVVEVEANVGRLSDLHLESLMRGKWLCGEREQDAVLVLERLSHRTRSVLDPRPVECRGRRPF